MRRPTSQYNGRSCTNVANFKKSLTFVGGVFLILVAWVIIANFLGKWLVVIKPLEKADTILVLAGSANYIERNTEAARLFNLGIAPKILLTNDHLKGGWDSEKQRNPYFVERAKWLLMEKGVPEDRIEILPGRIGGTDDEAFALATYMRTQPIESVLIVTSAYHTRRALWTFEKTSQNPHLAIKFGILSSDNKKGLPPDGFWWLNKTGIQVVVSEYIKLFYYFLHIPCKPKAY